MYAIIKAQGKQFQVKEGDILNIDRLKAKEGDKVEFEVLALSKDDGLEVGTPILDSVKVEAEVLKHFRGKKIIVFKKRRRKDSKRKRGFRRDLTKIKILKIVA